VFINFHQDITVLAAVSVVTSSHCWWSSACPAASSDHSWTTSMQKRHLLTLDGTVPDSSWPRLT